MDSKQFTREMEAAWLDIRSKMLEAEIIYGDSIPAEVIKKIITQMQDFQNQYGSNSEASRLAYPHLSKYYRKKNNPGQ
ncbi:MAG: hypothetical protein QM731_01345 [Chitinophagaceae bacterium]